MNDNRDGYDTEQMDDMSDFQQQQKQQQKQQQHQKENDFITQRPMKTRRQTHSPIKIPGICVPIAVSSNNAVASCGHPITDASNPNKHIHTCQTIDATVLRKKKQILRSLSVFPVVQKNEQLAADIATFETVFDAVCSQQSTVVSAYVLEQIDQFYDAIARVDAISTSMGRLALSTKYTSSHDKRCRVEIVILLLCLIVGAFMFCMSPTIPWKK